MCYLHRAKDLWRNNVLFENAAEGPVHIAVSYDAQNCPQGYLVYTVRFGRVADVARPQEMVVRELAWLTREAYQGLWEFVTRHDLVGRVRYDAAPSDDPAPELFEEPGRLHPQLVDGTWMRITDVIGALQARGYTGAGRLVLEISGDEMGDWNNGIFNVETDGEAVEVSRSSGKPDIQLSIKAFASLYCGSRSARALANWGLVTGDSRGIAAADLLFRTIHAPHCPDQY
jgi:predicted acetyltransferase